MSQVVSAKPNALKLLTMKQYGPLLELTMSIGDMVINAGSSITSDEYNIHKFIAVRFKVSKAAKAGNHHNHGYGNQQTASEYDVSIKKHILAKEMTVSMKIVCKEMNFRQEIIICTDDWSSWIRIGSMTYKCFTVNFEVTLSKVQSVINLKLYNDETFTDFTLSGEDGSVMVHKAHLAAHSETFTAMFNGQWKETEQGQIKLEGVSLQTLRQFKEYLYLSTLPDNNEDLRELLLLATQYLIDSLKSECTMKILQTITAENLDSLVEFCTENEIHELLRIIHETTPESILAAGYAIKIKKRIAAVAEVDGNKTKGKGIGKKSKMN